MELNVWQLTQDIANFMSQLFTMAVGGFGAWVAYQTLLRTPVQSQENLPAVGSRTAQAQSVEQLIVFDTRKQRTLLKATRLGLECHLIEKRDAKVSGRQWVLSSEFISQILENNDYHVHPSLRLNSGMFSIGPRRNWLYSKSLFPEPGELESQLKYIMNSVLKLTD